MVWQEKKGEVLRYWRTPSLGSDLRRPGRPLMVPGGNNGLAIRYPGKGNTAWGRHVRVAGAG